MKKKMMIQISLCIGLIAGLIFASLNNSCRNFIDRVFLPRQMAQYPSLQDGTLTSDDYELAQIISGDVRHLLWDSVGNQVIAIKEYDISLEIIGSVWKISPEGVVTDSIALPWRELGGFEWHEKFLLHNGYIDWIRTGDKSVKSYADTSEKQQAGQLLTELTNRIAPFQDWKNQDQLLVLQRFVRETRQRRPFYDINNTGRNGWNGTGYFQLRHREAFFHFKTYTFKSERDYQPDIALYNLSSEYDKDCLLLHLRKTGKSKRKYNETGIYVLRKIRDNEWCRIQKIK